MPAPAAQGRRLGRASVEEDHVMKLQHRSYRTAVFGLGLAAALGAGAYAMAQPAAPPANAPPRALTQEERQALREERSAEFEANRESARVAQLEGRLAFLRSRLAITDAQAALWDGFAAAVRNNAGARAAPPPPAPQEAPATLPERLDRLQARLAGEAQRVQATVNALRPLYNALSDEQKRVADRILDQVADGRMALRDGGRRGDFRGRGPGRGRI